jgi:hypothetical protein
MFHSHLHAPLFVPFMASTLLAVPKIQFDTITFQCGSAIGGKTEKLNAAFVVKNTGDELSIQRFREIFSSRPIILKKLNYG